MIGKLLNGTVCQILLDTGASELFMSKSHYFDVNPYIHYNILLLRPKESK